MHGEGPTVIAFHLILNASAEEVVYRLRCYYNNLGSGSLPFLLVETRCG
jgi:hypothetical protein